MRANKPTSELPSLTTFWSRVNRSAGPDSCWPWTGCADADGYGVARLNRRKIGAHRAALILALGRGLRPGMKALHSCDNPPCCNPAHLREGTNTDNMADARRRGRLAPQAGECNGNARFTDAERAEICTWVKAGFLQREVAAVYGTSQGHVSYLVSRAA